MRSRPARRRAPKAGWSWCNRRSRRSRPEGDPMHSLLMRRVRKPAELLLVPMIDIFTVLVTFLLMTAVFSRITIIQMGLPSSAAAKPAEPQFRFEVISRNDGFDLSDGKQLSGTIPKANDAYDLTALTARVLDVKRELP